MKVLTFVFIIQCFYLLTHSGQSGRTKCDAPRKKSFKPPHGEPLTIETVNNNVLNVDYAVRGEVLIKANEIEEQLSRGNHKYPFDKVIKCNIGNPQALGQKPITFFRRVLSLVINPELMSDEAFIASYPSDVLERARRYLQAVRSVGAYSESNGVQLVRNEIAEFIHKRDGGDVKVDSKNIFITDGASDAVEKVMKLLIRNSDDAILTPIPQYPLYSALTTVLDGYFAPYYMGEVAGWELDMKEVRRAFYDAHALNKTVRGMVVINPGKIYAFNAAFTQGRQSNGKRFI